MFILCFTGKMEPIEFCYLKGVTIVNKIEIPKSHVYDKDQLLVEARDLIITNRMNLIC